MEVDLPPWACWLVSPPPPTTSKRKMHHTPKQIALAFVFVLGNMSCSSEDKVISNTPPVTLVDMATMEPDESPHAQEDFSTSNDANTTTQEDFENPMLVDASPSNEQPKEVKFSEFLQSDWEQDNPCRDTVTPPIIEGDFQYPIRSTAYHIGKSSREKLAEFAQGTAYTFVHQVTFDDNLRPDRRSIVLHRNDDEDVHLYIHTVVQPDDIERINGMLTVLVDYQPVEATYKFSRDRWDNVVFSKQATSTRFPVDTQFSMMEIVLPAALLAEERMYEIAIGQITNRYNGSDGGVFRKIHLFNRSYERSAHPCFEEPLDAPANTIEYGLIRENVSAGVILFPTHYPAVNEVAFEELLPAEPGQKIQINLSLRSKLNAVDRTRLVFLKPLLDGKPLEYDWRVSLTPKGSGSFKIDARKTFEVTLPEEPGIYEVSMAVWHDPHLMAVDLNGDNQAGISNGNGGDTSNLLRFEVKAPDDTTSPDE